MKTKFLNISVLTLLLFIAASCGEQDVRPENDREAAEAQAARESENARRSSGKVLIETITGSINGIPFTAEFQISHFTSEGGPTIKSGGQLYAVGKLKKIVGENLPAAVAELTNQEIKVPATYQPAAESSSGRTAATCDILNLVLGPLDLNILGLEVHLNQVILDIVAVTGAGNLLGNLLCALVSLFDGAGALAAIVQLLNQIIDIIGVIGG